MVSSAVISYILHSKIIENVTIVSARTANIDKLLTKIRNSIPESKWGVVNIEYFPSMDYLEKLSPHVSAENIRTELLKRFESDDNIWWIHNYHLGKNPLFTKALVDIAHSGRQKIVFQIHDFPECSRYSLLRRLRHTMGIDIYPQNGNVHYAVINQRDYRFLIQAGMDKKQISILENPIAGSKFNNKLQNRIKTELSGDLSMPFPSWKKEQPYMIYPVRAIRRKNIIEAALIAVLSEKNLIITLPGVSDAEIKYSEKCERVFKNGFSPGMFGIGLVIEDHGISFEELIGSASMVLSTSVQEGFGYLFLNSLNWGKPLLAKDLDILDSFKDSFKNYPASFYDHFSIPLKESDKRLLGDLYRNKIESMKNTINHWDKENLHASFSQILNKKYTDFSYLTVNMQIKILEVLKTDTVFLERCRRINKFHLDKLNYLFDIKTSSQQEILQEKWSYSSYCRKSEEIIKLLDINRRKNILQMQKHSISEAMEHFFTTREYFRLLYDE